MSNARTERNKAVKAILAKAFAPHKVSVTGDRGTAYSWTRIYVDYAPKTNETWRRLDGLIFQACARAGIKFPTSYGDGPGDGDYPCVTIEFNRERLVRQ